MLQQRANAKHTKIATEKDCPNDKKQPIVLRKLNTEVKIIEFNGLKWIDIIRPTNKEIKMLEDMYDFHELLFHNFSSN